MNKEDNEWEIRSEKDVRLKLVFHTPCMKKKIYRSGYVYFESRTCMSCRKKAPDWIIFQEKLLNK